MIAVTISQSLPLAQWNVSVAAAHGNETAPLPPLTACQDMMAATLASGAFQGSYKFTGPEGPVKGKRMSNEATRAQLQVGHTRRRSGRRAAGPSLGSKGGAGHQGGWPLRSYSSSPLDLLQASHPRNATLRCAAPRPAAVAAQVRELRQLHAAEQGAGLVHRAGGCGGGRHAACVSRRQRQRLPIQSHAVACQVMPIPLLLGCAAAR